MFPPHSMDHSARHAEEAGQPARAPAVPFGRFDGHGGLYDPPSDLIMNFRFAAGAGAFMFDPVDPVMGESNSPAPRSFPRNIQGRSNLRIAATLECQQDNICTPSPLVMITGGQLLQSCTIDVRHMPDRRCH
jgi:hypothetical protein